MSDKKACTQCGVKKAVDEFHRQRRGLYGRHSKCKECTKEHTLRRYREDPQRSRRWRRENPEKWKKIERRSALKKYGITPEDYDSLFESQEGLCAICGKPPERPHVDHDHGTGVIRGIICQKHNHAIGLLDDDPELCLKVAEYLRRHQCSVT